MRSSLAKVLHPVAGRPMIHYPVRSALRLGADLIVPIVGHQREAVEAYLQGAFPRAPLRSVVQAEQRGTAHAVACARDALTGFDGRVVILSGDVPALPDAVLESLVAAADAATVTLVSMTLPDPQRYGRVIRDSDGAVASIVEAGDATPDQLQINEVNAGIYCVEAGFLFPTLDGIGTDNAQGEFYLTDLIAIARAQGRRVEAITLDGADAERAHGINDRVDLARAEALLQFDRRQSLMRAGVTMRDPTRVWIDDAVEIGSDCVLEPDVSLLGTTRVASGCVVEQGARLLDTTVGEGTRILAYTVAEHAEIGPACQVGPFARLREGTVLGRRVKLGNFVETKKTRLAEGAKASHLSYLGDATVGAGANIGAGTITCNYDGDSKYPTTIGAGAFIGSDTQLVAPVEVEAGAYVGAGTTVTQRVPAGSLALSRVRQRNVEGWVERRKILPGSND